MSNFIKCIQTIIKFVFYLTYIFLCLQKSCGDVSLITHHHNNRHHHQTSDKAEPRVDRPKSHTSYQSFKRQLLLPVLKS